MNTYFALFLIATFTSLAITPLVRRLCQRFRLLDLPNDERKVHVRAVPRLGGIAVFLSMIAALSALPFVDNLLTQSLRSYVPDLLVTLIPAVLVLCLGVYDDLRGANATVKFIALALIATLFYFMGGRIEVLAIPMFGTVELPSTIGFIVTVVWLVGIANAFNLIDGMDGLASGAALFSSIVILVISLSGENALMIVVTLVMCGALAGFLRYNFNPASIFLGDSGSLFVGFTLAALSVFGTQKATTAVAVITPILAFGLPVVDTGVTLARRMIGGRPLFQGDSEHIHHMLLARGWSQRHVVLVLYAVCAAFGLLAAIFTKTSSPLTGLALFVITVAVIVAVGHLRYHEVEEIRAGVKRTVADRRIRVANNIRIRRASLALSKANNLDDVLEAVKQLLEFGEFAYANMQLGQAGHAEVNERVMRTRHHRHSAHSVELRNGRVNWWWHNGDIEPDDVIGSRDYWSFRMPLKSQSDDLGWINFYRAFDSDHLLIDMNYLSGPFREQLSLAAERIFAAVQKDKSSEEIAVRINPKEITS